MPDRKSNLQHLESKIKDVNLAEIFKQMIPIHHTVIMPKLKVEYEIELNEVLKKVLKIFSSINLIL